MTTHAPIVLAAAAAVSLPAAASASVITHDMLESNQSSTLLNIGDDAVNVQALGGAFLDKTVAGHTATGIAGGSVTGEIDNAEAMSFQFDQPMLITSLSVAFLYTAGNHGDTWNEVAQFTTDSGSFTLEAAGAETAAWSGYGQASNVSPGVEGHGGIWNVAGEDIFGGPVTTLTLSSGNPGSGGQYGDFSFHSMTYNAVPAPGAAALFACLAIGRRRRRA